MFTNNDLTVELTITAIPHEDYWDAEITAYGGDQTY